MGLSDLNKYLDERLAEREKIKTRAESVISLKFAQPTKTGPRKNRAERKRAAQKRKAQQILSKLQGDLNKGEFFYREILAVQPDIVILNKDLKARMTWGASTGFQNYIPPKSQFVKIAKILDGDLWIRNDHKSVTDYDATKWSKAKNASTERLTQEIRAVGAYLNKHEILTYRAEVLLDLLYQHLGSKVK